MLEAFPPATAAAHLGDLTPDRAIALIGMARVQSAAAALRHLPQARRALLLDTLPTARAVTCRLLLGYPDASVGAWTDPEIVVGGPETRVGEANARLGEEPDRDVNDGVYVVDAAGRLLGVVPLGTIVRAPAHLRLDGLMRPPPALLPAAMPITAALGLPAWNEALSLPVIDSRDRLLGRVLRAMLMRTAARAPRDDADRGTLIGALAATYWAIVSGLLGAGVNLLPATRPVGRAGR